MHQAALKAEELFFAALELESPEARSAFLDRHCGDAELRREVEELLALDSEANDFLEAPASSPTVSVAVNGRSGVEGPGTVIGPYRLMEAIGEGGMGTVYMAEQVEPVRRRVALKVIKPGMDSRQVVARFEAERQALALMDHPNIAKVHDGGMTPSGRPYFAMELVRGLSITEYCDQYELSIPERLELFVLVCRAVQHAHQKGVIHRDLKPSNVLVTVVDGVGVPKVIDFGVAKATGGALTDRTLFTGFHQFVGTPLYTSPEQAELSGVDVDTRSDIYSLGVLLYELLTGTTPFDSEALRKAAFDEMRRIIREEEPPRPSTRLSSLGDTLSTVSARRKADPRRLGATIRGELDWVVMKALEKDRRRRYETASDFAADVMRYLTDRPVEAFPPSAWYRFAKFARRNRVALTTAGLLAAVSVATITVGAALVWREKEQTRRALLQSQAHARTAEERLGLARRAVDEMYTGVAEKWLAQEGKLTALQRQFLEKALAFYEGFAIEKAGDPKVGLEAARARYRAATIQNTLGLLDRAETSFRQTAAELQRLTAASDDDVAVRREASELLASVEEDFANLLGRTGRMSDAADLLRRVLRRNEERLTTGPKNPIYRFAVVSNLANLANQVGDAEERFTHQRRAIDFLTELAHEYPDNPSIIRGLVLVQTNYAMGLSGVGKTEEAERVLRSAVATAEVLGKDRSESLDSLERHGLLAKALGMLGSTLLKTGKTTEAEGHVRRATEILEGLVAYPDLASHLLEHEYSLLSEWYMEARGVPGFDPMRPLALARRVAEQAPDNPFSWKHLALAEYLNGHWDESIQAVERWRKVNGGVYCYGTLLLASAYARKGDLGTARAHFELATSQMSGKGASTAFEPMVLTLKAEAEGLLSGNPKQ